MSRKREIPSRRIAVANRHRRLVVNRKALQLTLAALDAGGEEFRGGCPPGELSIAFLTDAQLARLHADFLNDPAPTDVITFAGDAAHGTAGEVCVSVDAAVAYAQRHGRDPADELILYLVHGWLHLAGYDDTRPDRKRRMRAAEARALRRIAAAQLPPVFRFR